MSQTDVNVCNGNITFSGPEILAKGKCSENSSNFLLEFILNMHFDGNFAIASIRLIFGVKKVLKKY